MGIQSNSGGIQVYNEGYNNYASSAHIMSGPVDRIYHFSDAYERTPRKSAPKTKRSQQPNLSRSQSADSNSSTIKDKRDRIDGRSQHSKHAHNPARLPRRPLPPPPGLKNVGNSCYANAALQCLLSTALPHALLSERNAHIIRRHSFNRKLLISGSGSVDSEEQDDEGSKDADSVFGSYLSGMTGLCSLEEDDEVLLARTAGDNDLLASPPPSARKKKRRDDGTVASYGSLTSDMYHGLKKRQNALNKEPSEADLLCLWLTQELTQITREYTTPPQNFLGERRKHIGSKGSAGSCSNGIIGSFFGVGGSAPSKNDSLNRVVDPGAITRHVHKISPTLRPYQQEDAHEFFRSLLSSLTMNGQNARLSSLFDGLLESSVTCKTCRKSSLTRDRYMDLSLDIADRGVDSLERALAKFTEEETLDDDNMVTCSRCKVKRAVTKGLRLATAPTMLVINYKRFAYDNYGRLSRLSKQVTFPLRLELKDYMSRANRGKPPPYSLVAVLVHRGRSCDCGHYFAYVRKGQDWYLANDDVVTKVDVDEVLSAQAYVLVYEVEGMKEKHNFDCYSRYHRSFNDLENDEEKGKKQEREKLSSWDFSAFTHIFEACEVGFCGAANSVISPGGNINPTTSSLHRHKSNNFNTYEDVSATDKSPKLKNRKTLEDGDATDAKERDVLQAYYKRGRSHTPSRQSRKREDDATNKVSMYDCEPRIEGPRRAKSVSRVEDIKSSRNTSVKRYTKARMQRRDEDGTKSLREGDLPPLHVPRQREV
ncbi:hypothetical protein ACHAW6_008010 [Cyclotella cf. meneghiniana]